MATRENGSMGRALWLSARTSRAHVPSQTARVRSAGMCNPHMAMMWRLPCSEVETMKAEAIARETEILLTHVPALWVLDPQKMCNMMVMQGQPLAQPASGKNS